MQDGDRSVLVDRACDLVRCLPHGLRGMAHRHSSSSPAQHLQIVGAVAHRNRALGRDDEAGSKPFESGGLARPGRGDVDPVGAGRGEAVGLAQEELAAPDAAVAYGVSLRGIWHSHYTYESTGRGPITRHHHVIVRQEGNRLSVESLRDSNDSPVSLSMTMRGPIGTGTWTEHTAVDGYYQGAVYHGALQVIVDPTGRTMAGK